MTAFDPQPGDFVSETLWTDTRVYTVVKRTAKTITVRPCLRGARVKRDNPGGNPWPVDWDAAHASDDDSHDRTLRLRKDGTYRSGPGGRPFRPATRIDGVPCFYTDYRE